MKKENKKIKEIIVAAGRRFAGVWPDEAAKEWADEGFGPLEVAEWVRVGVWSPDGAGGSFDPAGRRCTGSVCGGGFAESGAAGGLLCAFGFFVPGCPHNKRSLRPIILMEAMCPVYGRRRYAA